ncbi:MAG: hypothetical protein KGI41_02575 [Patescibacteria group bacterium]|nr:hypothetical protein [Patescibacteria group bacterium]MDE1966100.1 hypothetical protein [Patescibacteria group bacterium]
MIKDTLPFRIRLEEEKARLENELASVGRKNPSNPNDWEPVPQDTELESDPSDVADQITGYEDNTAILKDLEIRYNLVLDALARIEKGTYGICRVDGKGIEKARLEADPAATTCKEHLNTAA